MKTRPVSDPCSKRQSVSEWDRGWPQRSRHPRSTVRNGSRSWAMARSRARSPIREATGRARRAVRAGGARSEARRLDSACAFQLLRFLAVTHHAFHRAFHVSVSARLLPAGSELSYTLGSCPRAGADTRR